LINSNQNFKGSQMNHDILRAIANANAANANFYVSASEGKPLVSHKPPLIEVDSTHVDPDDSTKIAARLTKAGHEMIAETGHTTAHTKPIYAVETGGFVAPKSKRGGGTRNSAPSKYDFEGMDVGAFFFVPNSDVKGEDAVKTVGSAVGAANQKYSEATGEHKSVTRAKRDAKNRAIKDADGANVTETVEVAVKKALRHYKVSRVHGGVSYGAFTAPDDGAVVHRVS
jgi:hypothetical protein